MKLQDWRTLSWNFRCWNRTGPKRRGMSRRNCWPKKISYHKACIQGTSGGIWRSCLLFRYYWHIDFTIISIFITHFCNFSNWELMKITSLGNTPEKVCKLCNCSWNSFLKCNAAVPFFIYQIVQRTINLSYKQWHACYLTLCTCLQTALLIHYFWYCPMIFCFSVI